MISTLLRGAAAATIALGLSAGLSVAQDAPIETRLSVHYSSNSPNWKQVYLPYIASLEALSSGKLKVTGYPDGVIHSAGGAFKALAGDLTDITAAFPIYLEKSFRLFHANELPGAFANPYVATRVITELYPEFYREEYENAAGYLAYMSVTPAYDIITKTPIRSVEDLKGLKIRAAGGTNTRIMELLGAVPVNIPITETYTAFQQGIVDGVALSTASMLSWRMHEIGKYNYRIGFSQIAAPMAINKAFFDRLPDEAKKAIADAGVEAMIEDSKMYEQETEAAIKALTEAGVENVEPNAEDRAKINAILSPLWDEFVEKNKDVGDGAAQKLVDRMRALSAKYGAMTTEEIVEVQRTQPVTGLRPGS